MAIVRLLGRRPPRPHKRPIRDASVLLDQVHAHRMLSTLSATLRTPSLVTPLERAKSGARRIHAALRIEYVQAIDSALCVRDVTRRQSQNGSVFPVIGEASLGDANVTDRNGAVP